MKRELFPWWHFYQLSTPSKNLREVKKDILWCSTLVCQTCYDTVKSCWFGQAWLPFDETMLIPPINILIFHVPGAGFQVSCWIAFLGIEVRLSSQLFPGPCFLPLKKRLKEEHKKSGRLKGQHWKIKQKKDHCMPVTCHLQNCKNF